VSRFMYLGKIVEMRGMSKSFHRAEASYHPPASLGGADPERARCAILSSKGDVPTR